mgnify:CR=1 FL=1
MKGGERWGGTSEDEVEGREWWNRMERGGGKWRVTERGEEG